MAQKFTGIQALFFNFYARLYTLRVVILCALVGLLSSLSFMQSKVFNKAWAILLVFVIFHHILSAVKLKYIPGILDLVLTLGETIGSVYYARKLPNIKPYSPEIDAYHVVASWILVAGLSILSIFKLATVTKAPISLIQDCNFLGDREKNVPIFQVYLGRSFWKEHFSGESSAVRSLRGLLGFIFTMFLIFFAMIHLVFQPIRETALTPVQEYRVTQIPPDRDIAQGLWNIMIPITQGDAVGEQMALNAFNVTPSANNRVPNGTEQGCFHLRPPKSSAKNTKFTALTFQCVTNVLDARNLPDIPRSVTIAINFTQLVADMQQMRHIPLFLDSLGPGVTIVVAMTNQNVTSVQTLLQKTPPLSIIANSNVVAAVARDVRETFRSPALAAVGLYEAMFSFWTPRIMNINVDTTIPPIANVSTLRLYIPIFSDTVSERGFVSEIRNFSVLSGFSSIGGLWTTLSGTFAILFGGSLLHFLSGSKSISIIGIAHTFQRATMKKHCFDQYRDLPNDQKNRGVLALIRDYAIDLSFLDVAEEDDVEKQAILPDDVPVYESL